MAKENASKTWQDIVGPEEPAKASETAPTRFVHNTYDRFIIVSFNYCSIRAIYGKDLVHNAVDVSSDAAQVKNNMDLIFGDLDREEHGKKIE